MRTAGGSTRGAGCSAWPWPRGTGSNRGQVWEHAQRLRGGLDVLAGVANAEQGSGIEPLWGPVGGLLATLPAADVIADCGRLGPDSPYYELLAQAAIVVLVIRPSLGEVLRLRDRVAAVALAVGRRGGHQRPDRGPGGRRAPRVTAVRWPRWATRSAVRTARSACSAGSRYEPKSAQRLRGEWGGRLDRSLLIRTARDAAAQLAGEWLPDGRPPVTGQRVLGLREPGRRVLGRPVPSRPVPGRRVLGGPVLGRPVRCRPVRCRPVQCGPAVTGWAPPPGARR